MRAFPKAIRLRSALGILVAACTIPAIILAVLTLWQEYSREYARLVEQESATARAVSALIDRDLSAVVGSLHTLGYSTAIMKEGMATFQRQARHALPTIPSSRDIYLTDTSGRLLMSTRAPLSTNLPMSGNPAIARKVVETGQPQISDLFIGTLTGRRLVSVGVPVLDAAGKVKFALFSSLDIDKMAALLQNGQLVPGNWIVSVHDRSGRFIARSRDHERFNGQTGSADLMAAMARGPEGTLEGTTREGIKVIAAFTPSHLSGWTVAVGVPKEHLLAGLRQQIMFAVGGVLLMLLAGLGAARALSLRIERAVTDLMPQAARLSSYETFAPLESPIVELNVLSGSLSQASQVLRSTREEAQHDPLTGLANRKLLKEILEFQINFAKRTETSVALLYIDLDGFKAINDCMGHLAGDEVLAATSSRMRDLVRASDCAARLGGDEFVIALSATDASGAETLAKRLIADLSAPIDTSCGPAMVHASIGIALYPYSASDADELILSADEAMYRSKAAGKNRFTMQTHAAGNSL